MTACSRYNCRPRRAKTHRIPVGEANMVNGMGTACCKQGMIVLSGLALVLTGVARGAEDYAALINRGGVVDLPAGVIEISAPLHPPHGAGLVLRGQGPNR